MVYVDTTGTNEGMTFESMAPLPAKKNVSPREQLWRGQDCLLLHHRRKAPDATGRSMPSIDERTRRICSSVADLAGIYTAVHYCWRLTECITRHLSHKPPNAASQLVTVHTVCSTHNTRITCSTYSTRSDAEEKQPALQEAVMASPTLHHTTPTT